MRFADRPRILRRRIVNCNYDTCSLRQLRKMEKWSPFGETAHLSAKETINVLPELKIRSLDLLFLFYQKKRKQSLGYQPNQNLFSNKFGSSKISPYFSVLFN